MERIDARYTYGKRWLAAKEVEHKRWIKQQEINENIIHWILGFTIVATWIRVFLYFFPIN